MCGILFSYKPGVDSDQHRFLTDKAVSRLQHRGPDEHASWQEQACIIAHTRLSIIDLSTSQQPFVSPCGRYILSFNGEIYNYQSLRNQLSSQWTFRTHGDTEVLLAGLLLEGDTFVKKMEGMWAFLLWDKQQQSLLLCRDRLGKKPLYYHNTATDFSACSELPALLSLSTRPVEEDLDSTADYLRYGFFLPGHTIYRDVCEIKPGHIGRWSPNQPLQQQPFWQLSPARQLLSHQEALAQLDQLMLEAVEKRLVADVEVGAFLSGGIDSSIIVGIIRERLSRPLKTFTMGFQEASFDESSFARQIAGHHGTEHFEKIFDNWDPDHLTRLIVDHVGQPFADPSILPTSMVSELAAEHVKVALSGDGGDELFSGYQRYQARAILRWYTRLPGPVRGNLEAVIKALPEPTSHHSRSIIKKAHLFLATIDRLESETPYIAPMFYSNQQIRELCPQIAGSGHHTAGSNVETKLDDIHQMMYQDALVYLPQDILLKVDRASMAHSLEARAPFLDHKLVELAFSLPIGWHRGAVSGKKMLRQCYKPLLPDSIWKRRKQGFGVPLGEWFKASLGTELIQLNESHDTPLNRHYVSEMLLTHRQGKRDMSLRLWQLYSYLKWKDLSLA